MARIRTGDRVTLKLNPYPTRGFVGTVSRVGAQVREEDKERFVIAEVKVDNPDGSLKTGMLGQAKISTRRAPVVVTLLRKPARYFWKRSGLSCLEHRSRQPPRRGIPSGPGDPRARRPAGPPDERPALRKDLVIRRHVQMGTVILDRQEPRGHEVLHV